MLVGLLVELGVLLLLGFLPGLMFLDEVVCILRLGELRFYISAIPIHIGLLVQVGLRYQKSPY